MIQDIRTFFIRVIWKQQQKRILEWHKVTACCPCVSVFVLLLEKLRILQGLHRGGKPEPQRYLLVVILLPLTILVEVETDRKLPIPPPWPPPWPPPKEVEEKEVKPPPPRLPRVLMEPKEVKPATGGAENLIPAGDPSKLWCGQEDNGFSGCLYSSLGRLTRIKGWEASTKRRKSKTSKKCAPYSAVVCPTVVVAPTAAEERVITKWVSTWDDSRGK